MDRSEQRKLIRRCLDLGVNLFDTAENYGESEAILGDGLNGVPRDSYHVITKWNMDNDGKIAKGESDLIQAVDKSLRLLGSDYVDVFQFHGAMPYHYDELVERFYPVVLRLKEQGKLRFTGVSTRYAVDPKQEGATYALKAHPEIWDTVMLKYGILNQWADREAMPLAAEHDVGIINMAAARIRLPDPELLEQTIAEWKDAGYVAHNALSERSPLDWLIHDDVESVVAAAYKFAANHKTVATVLTGTASIDHLEQNARALENPMLNATDSARIVELFRDIAEYA